MPPNHPRDLNGIYYFLTTDDAGGNPAIRTVAGAAPLPLAAATFAGQARVAVTGTPAALAANVLTVGVIINNIGSTDVTVGVAGVTNVSDGTGNGYVLTPGAAVSVATSNTSNIFINGVALTSAVSFIGS